MTHPDNREANVHMDNRPFAVTISAAELVARDDPEGALILLVETDVPHVHLARAALEMFAELLAGDGAAARFDEIRATVHQFAIDVGSDDRQVVLNSEVVG